MEVGGSCIVESTTLVRGRGICPSKLLHGLFLSSSFLFGMGLFFSFFTLFLVVSASRFGIVMRGHTCFFSVSLQNCFYHCYCWNYIQVV